MDLQKFDSVEAWLEEGKRRFGEDFMLWKFVCPVCKNVASLADFRAAGAADPNSATQECIGRYRKERAHPFGQGSDKVTQPCDYAGYGLFRLSPVRVVQSDGRETHSFAFADCGALTAEVPPKPTDTKA
jgi:hypothetical protein